MTSRLIVDWRSDGSLNTDQSPTRDEWLIWEVNEWNYQSNRLWQETTSWKIVETGVTKETIEWASLVANNCWKIARLNLMHDVIVKISTDFASIMSLRDVSGQFKKIDSFLHEESAAMMWKILWSFRWCLVIILVMSYWQQRESENKLHGFTRFIGCQLSRRVMFGFKFGKQRQAAESLPIFC